MHRILICILIGMLSFNHPGLKAHSEDHDKKEARVYWFVMEKLVNPFYIDNKVDTTITGFQRYDLYDTESLFWAGKGNVGHVARLLHFDPDMQSGFLLFANPLHPGYLLSLADQKYYRPKHVFSELFYVTGSEREQLFHAMHNQRLHENVYAGVKYQTVSSPGAYSRLAARNAAIELKVDAEIGERYGFLGTFALNRMINRESGGLKNHLHFEEDEVRDSVFLYAAESRYRDVGFRFKQYFRAGFSFDKDTIQGGRSISLGTFFHEFNYQRRAFIFDETTAPSGVFYENPAFNPDFTFDSTLVHVVSNRLTWSSHRVNGRQDVFPLHFDLSAEHSLINVRQPLYDVQSVKSDDDEEYIFERNRYAQLAYQGRVNTDPSRYLSFNARASYIMGGYNDKDLSLDGKLAIGGTGRAYRLAFLGAYAQREAPWFYNNFTGNYVSWSNDFRKTNTLRLGARIHTPMLSLEGNYYYLHRAVFMNTDAFPEQHDGGFPIYTASLSANLDAGFLRTHHRLVYQHTGEQAFDRFPKLLSYHSLYADFILFDDALHAHAGVDLRYNAPCRPMAYMPVVRQFYIQDDYKSDHVFLMDVFVNAKISRARLFVKLQNVLGLAFDMPQYYAIPFYPLPEGMFKFGVSWMFFD